KPGRKLGGLSLLDFEILRGCFSAVLDEFVLNGLSLVQGAKSGAFDRRDVHKHILPAFLGLDEAIALRRIEPLYGALRHATSPKYSQTLQCATVGKRRTRPSGPPLPDFSGYFCARRSPNSAAG